jgi:TonB-dependent SusC/RagA subfamily outer membrane receptor
MKRWLVGAAVLALSACGREHTVAPPQAAVQPAPPLFFVDGKEVSSDSALTFDAARIEQLDVLKGAAAIARYGERARNGVIIIKTKAR